MLLLARGNTLAVNGSSNYYPHPAISPSLSYHSFNIRHLTIKQDAPSAPPPPQFNPFPTLPFFSPPSACPLTPYTRSDGYLQVFILLPISSRTLIRRRGSTRHSSATVGSVPIVRFSCPRMETREARGRETDPPPAVAELRYLAGDDASL